MRTLTPIRIVKALALARGDRQAALSYIDARRDWEDGPIVKAAVAGLETAALGGGGVVAVDLSEALRALTLTGRMPLRRVPPMVPLLTGVAGTSAHFVGEGQARRLSVGTYSRDPGMRLMAVSAMCVASEESLADRSLEAESVLLADLLAACVEALDRAFVDPANGGDGGTPASVTSAATPIDGSGGTVAALDAALNQAVAELVAAGSTLRAAHWVMDSELAAGLALLRGSGGAPAYPGLGALGGTLAGLPVFTSSAMPVTTDGHQIGLIDAAEVSYADSPAMLRTSQQALIEMADDPSADILTPTGGSAASVSMFQACTVAVLASLGVNWKLRREGMAQIIQGVTLPAVVS